ncbi:DUF547 domain-containing protein [Marivirga sp. S37H4]|uniref:DUF547 domain-containing protein n=1 Tax=Marivirga aurantiaca TaxID=2802615 RepID=A0A934WVP3_9BACT|nr:DUF547 domain-containing protein [Marivirga aurantiaca]MBK6263796.1 DUF547 domain-containing protein [Marivirga aurantiaca]
MTRFIFSLHIIYFILLINLSQLKAQSIVRNETNEYVQISMKLLGAIKNKENYTPYIVQMKELSLDKLAKSLDTDNKTKAFWINVYNAYVQIILMENPSLFDERSEFFKADQINIGGEMMSFDFIEHGIIRGSKVKLSLGFLKDPFAGEIEKEFRVSETDGRIHFALNCGARSCPHIAIYSAVNLDEELDTIAKQFLERTTIYDRSENVVNVTVLFSWFRGDFTERGGVLGVLKSYNIIPEGAEPNVNYKEYDWTLDLGNFTDLKP